VRQYGRVQVTELWRFPVKSLQGERLERAVVTPDGLDGDRRFAFFDAATGAGLTARRVPELLFAAARATDAGGIEITFPDGAVCADRAEIDARSSQWLGRAVVLRDADFGGTRTYETPLEVDEDREDTWVSWNGPRGPFHDSPRDRVSLVSRTTTGAWDPRRFRANVVLDEGPEDELVGCEITIGGAVLEVVKPVDRCVMVTRPQPGGIERDVGVLHSILRERAGNLAVASLVVRAGTVAVGDAVVRH